MEAFKTVLRFPWKGRVSIARATEVGGFSVRESQKIIRNLKNIQFIGADVVEVSPPFDVNNMTSLVGANIAFEILCNIIENKK